MPYQRLYAQARTIVFDACVFDQLRRGINTVTALFKPAHRTGMQTFSIMWFGQLVSQLGTGMTRFALLIWAYEQTGSATTLALLGFFSWVPVVICSPIAGVWADRFDRRKLMMIGDLGAGLMTMMVMGLFFSGRLAIWHLYLLEATASAFESLQIPAYTAATSTILSKDEYARSNGMRTVSNDLTRIIAPVSAGILLAFIGIGGIMVIDVVTFFIAIATLLLVRIPRPARHDMGATRQPFWTQITFGFRYVHARKGLWGLMLIFTGINFFAALTYFAILPAMILARTGGDEVALASVQAVLGGAGVVGGIVVSVWGLPRRKIHVALAGCGISFLFGDLLFAAGRTLTVWLIAASVAAFFIPFIIAANRTIWQLKVPPDMQGRAFSIRQAFANASMPLGYLLAGPLADWVFEPAMQPGGAWADTFGWLVGTGPGAGMGLMFACTAFLGAAMSFGGYLFPALRRVEDELPDHSA